MTVSELKYLMAVSRYAGEGQGAKMSAVARELGVSKVSVYHGMERLQEGGYIGRNGKSILLTEKGRQTVDEYSVIITFIRRHLQCHCGTPADVAQEDAVGAACAFSDESRRGVAEFVKSGRQGE